MLLTKEALRQKEKELDNLNEELDKVRKEKALQISQSDGDGRHDNFGFEQAEIQERAVIKRINDLKAELSDVSIIEETQDVDKNIVQIGSIVKLRLDYGGGNIAEEIYRLQVLPSFEEEIVTLNSPMGKAIFQKEIGAISEFKIANGNKVVVEIIEIS